MGNRDIEDSLERLDKLTLEEGRMASAEQLKMTHSVGGKVMDVDDRVRGVEGQVQDVRCDVQDVRGDVQDVGDKVQDVDDKLDEANRSSSLDPDTRSAGSDNFTGNQLRDNLLRWLSPPDPSTNHNIACKAHHNGTTQWFFQGSIYNQWKSTGALLWVHGKRALLLTLTIRRPLIIPHFYSWFRKDHSLVCRFCDPFHLFETDIMNAVRQSYKILCRCAMPGRPPWPTSILTSGTSINRTCATCFRLFSSNSLLNPILVVTYSPDSIPSTIVG